MSERYDEECEARYAEECESLYLVDAEGQAFHIVAESYLAAAFQGAVLSGRHGTLLVSVSLAALVSEDLLPEWSGTVTI